MAERLIASMAIVAASVLAWAACAQALSDPTRPPGPEATAAPAAGDPPGAQPEAKPAPRLQSILISPARKLAVIDGNTVALGGKFDGAVLVAITETHVTLKRGTELEVLPLYPGVERKPIPKGQAK